jgi:hypothetical protein
MSHSEFLKALEDEAVKEVVDTLLRPTGRLVVGELLSQLRRMVREKRSLRPLIEKAVQTLGQYRNDIIVCLREYPGLIATKGEANFVVEDFGNGLVVVRREAVTYLSAFRTCLEHQQLLSLIKLFRERLLSASYIFSPSAVLAIKEINDQLSPDFRELVQARLREVEQQFDARTKEFVDAKFKLTDYTLKARGVLTELLLAANRILTVLFQGLERCDTIGEETQQKVGRCFVSTMGIIGLIYQQLAVREGQDLWRAEELLHKLLARFSRYGN